MVVDIFTHFLPTRYFQQMIEVAPEFDRLRTLAPIHDLDARLRTMDVLHDYRQILSLPNPLDDPTFEPVFAAMAGYDLPIWLHPTRTAGVADYPTESRSRYEMWWTFGWPYETSVAMARLVVTGLFARHPTIKIITHHCRPVRRARWDPMRARVLRRRPCDVRDRRPVRVDPGDRGVDPPGRAQRPGSRTGLSRERRTPDADGAELTRREGR